MEKSYKEILEFIEKYGGEKLDATSETEGYKIKNAFEKKIQSLVDDEKFGGNLDWGKYAAFQYNNIANKTLWGRMRISTNEPIDVFAELDPNKERSDGCYFVGIPLNQRLNNTPGLDRQSLLRKNLCIVERNSDKNPSPEISYDYSGILESKTDEELKNFYLGRILHKRFFYDDEIGHEVMVDSINELLHYLEPEISEDEPEIPDDGAFDKNIILYGPPGTGKTYNTVRYAVAICEKKKKQKDLEKEIIQGTGDYSAEKNRYKALMCDPKKGAAEDKGQIQSITFHQSYSYEEFIEGIRPKLAPKNESVSGGKTEGDIKYVIHKGVFRDFCEKAENHPDKNYVFIIDEINRGNISKIFGELITLIEDSKRGDTKVSLPYSKDPFTVPKNVYILGTMNTADRSIALLDTALRRRFSFVEMQPNSDLLKNVTVKDANGSINVKEMLDEINERIKKDYDREHTIGHSYFMKLTEENGNTPQALEKIFEKNVIPLLQEYFCEDGDKFKTVLGDKLFVEGTEEINYDALSALSNYPTYKKNESGSSASADQ